MTSSFVFFLVSIFEAIGSVFVASVCYCSKNPHALNFIYPDAAIRTPSSQRSRRIRLHRIAQTYVTMLNAGALIYRDEKPPIFSPSARGPFCIEQPCFYDSREMKEAELETLKIRGSRMAGTLFTSSRVFAVYNSMEFLPVFEPQVEQRAKAMLEQIYRKKFLSIQNKWSFTLRQCGHSSHPARAFPDSQTRPLPAA